MPKATNVATGGATGSRGDDGLLTEAVDDLAGLTGPDSAPGASRFLKAKADGTT